MGVWVDGWGGGGMSEGDLRPPSPAICESLASYPGSPAFIQLERNKEGNKKTKRCVTL